MPDQNVDLTYDPSTTPPTWTFAPPSVTMTASGKVILHQAGSNATSWTFTGGNVKSDPLSQFSSTVQGNGTLLHINDAFKNQKGTPPATYPYYVIISANGVSVTSPDPDIVNDPGSVGSA
jgi:hypothetical protein